MTNIPMLMHIWLTTAIWRGFELYECLLIYVKKTYVWLRYMLEFIYMLLFSGKLTLKIPWKNLYTEPTVALLDGLFVILVSNTSMF